jgi:hypothetical protein
MLRPEEMESFAWTLEFGDDADNVRYDQLTGDIWVGYGNGGIGIVNSVGQKVGSVDLGTHPESFQFEQSGDRVYANVPKQFGVSVIDRTDDVFYDKTRRVVYVIGGEGAVEVFRQRDPDHYESVGRTTTAAGARTGFFLQNSSRLYVAVPHRGSEAAKVLVYASKGG